MWGSKWGRGSERGRRQPRLCQQPARGAGCWHSLGCLLPRSLLRRGVSLPLPPFTKWGKLISNPKVKDLLRCSGCTRPPLRNGLDFSICTFNCRSLSRDERIDHLLQEIEKCHATSTACASNSKGGAQHDLKVWMVQFSWTKKSMSKIGFVLSRKWSSLVIFYQFRSPRVSVLLLRLDSKKVR